MKFLTILLVTLFYQGEAQKNTSIMSIRLKVSEDQMSTSMDAPLGSIPYQVSLRQGDAHFCGAAILNKRWIITAAHCAVAFSKDDIKAVVGTNSLASGGESYDIESIIVHPDFEQTYITNDLSVMKTAKPIKFSKIVKPIPLPAGQTKPGADVMLSGWGKSREDSPLPSIMQMVNQSAISLQSCKKTYEKINIIVDTQLCTVNSRGVHACQGDSGGPLAENHSIVGIVSWGVDCRLGYPDIATYVYKYLDWINKYISDTS